MKLGTVVENYVAAAIELAEVTRLESGTFAATVPGCPGIVACGEDVHLCAEELYRRLQQWALVSLTRGNRLPMIGGIDLNADRDRILATYGKNRVAEARRSETIYRNEAELEAAFAEIDRLA